MSGRPKRQAATKKKVEEEENEEEIDPTNMLVSELKDELRSRGLSTSGNKAALVKRLQKALESDGEEEEEEEEEKTTTKRSTRGKGKEKKEDADEEEEEEEAEEEEEEEKKGTKRKKGSTAGKHKVDQGVRLSGCSVHEDWDCMLNQTNIRNNNNKFYVAQILDNGGSYYFHTRWGRVGEPGQSATKGPWALNKCETEFKKKFKEKTGNLWDERDNFEAVSGKYTLIEMDLDGGSDEEELEAKLSAVRKKQKSNGVKESALPLATQELVNLIFDLNMFKQAMESFNIDVKKMPLGKISKSQIAKGFAVLEKIGEMLSNGNRRTEAASSEFYTLIPHSFGRQRPPPIADLETLQQKKDMLNVLGDIELAQSLTKEKEEQESQEEQEEELAPNPIDTNYGLLGADVEPLDKSSDEFRIIKQYLTATEGSWNRCTIKHIYRVARHGEETRFQQHDHITNRKLLWHGTNVAVVVAILSSGLRIMPHSGGRVGKGIYFASEHSKSAGYVGKAGRTGIMFLSEVALGKEWHITQDDCTLRQPPSGYDCIIAKGWTEPDPSKDTVIKIEGKDVVVPQGPPIKMQQYSNSSFSQSEYLVYKESQNRIRYLLMLDW
ncbi:Poly [ADP-ribose] polymerase 3 [Balamuthia mandrillaris]